MWRRFARIAVLGVWMFAGFAGTSVLASSPYPELVRSTCLLTTTPSCSSCHTSIPALNATGITFRDAPAPRACAICPDNDGDSYRTGDGTCSNVDCNDSNSAVHPGATEVCNGVNDDCDGQTDEGLGTLSCGVGACARTVQACVSGSPQVCSPGSPTAEACNSLDDDCDGQTDEGLGTLSCGVGACENTVQACVSGSPQVCSPGSPTAETCNSLDDDCDGVVDDGCAGGLFIDFGPGTIVPESGYSRDAGAAFDDMTGYGWLASVYSSRDRGCASPPLRQQSLLVLPSTRTWETAVEMGDFDVTVSLGDCSYAQGPQSVTVEGVPFVSNELSSAGQFLVRTRRVRVLDGRLSVTAGGAGGFTVLNYIEIRPAAEQPAPLLAINFQPEGSPTPSGFLADFGDPWSGVTGRGWSRNLRSRTRDRDRNDDQALDTFAFAQTGTETYEVALPEGDYETQLAVGDASYAQGQHRVTVEGIEAFNGETTTANQFLSKTLRVSVLDGRLSVQIGGTPGVTTLAYLSITAATQPAYRVNFQPQMSVPVEGYLADWGAPFHAQSGFGWLSSQVGRTRDRGENADQRLDTLLFVGATPQTWEAEVAQGDYGVTVSVGDPSYPQGPQVVRVEDVDVFTEEQTPVGTFLTRSVRVPVRDGRLSVRVGGGAGNTTINSIEVDRVPTLAAFNFQPASSVTPVGFTADSGEAYSAAAGHGWQDDFLSLSGRSRERGTVANQALDTFLYTWSPAETWKLDVPDGDYEVTVAAGDALYDQGPHLVVVEGTTCVSDVSTPRGSFVTSRCCVSVNDGQLTLEMGGTAGNTTLNHVSVISQACPPESLASQAVVDPATPLESPEPFGDRDALDP